MFAKGDRICRCLSLVCLLVMVGYASCTVGLRLVHEGPHDHDHGHDHDHDHDHDHSGGVKEDIPDCMCVIPYFNCLEGGRLAAEAVNKLNANNCTQGDRCRTNAVCQEAFFTFTALHDGCRDGALAMDQEIDFHIFEEPCKACRIPADAPSTATICPSVNCTDTSTMEMAYEYLMYNCSGICSTDLQCMEVWEVVTAYHDECPVLDVEYGELFHILEGSCPPKCVVEAAGDDEIDCESEINRVFAANSTQIPEELSADVLG